MNSNSVIVGVHSRHLVAGSHSLAGSVGLDDCTIVDLNDPVYDLLSALDPLVAPGQSLCPALRDLDGWEHVLTDRIIGAEACRLVIACRQTLTLDAPNALHDEAAEAIGEASGVVLVSGLSNLNDAAFVRSLGGQIWSIEYATTMGMPVNPALPLSWVDHFLPTPTLCSYDTCA